MRTISKKVFAAFCLIFIGAASVKAQQNTKPSIAVISIEVKGIIPDAETVKQMVNMQLEKTNMYGVTDKYEVRELMKQNNIDETTCLSKACLVRCGQLLKTEKVMSGSVERMGEKIVVTLRVFDVASGNIEKTEVTEYFNIQNEIPNMIMISVKKLTGLTPDPTVADVLISYQTPISTPKTQLKLNGPRMGFAYTTGENGERLTAPKNDGGFDMMPITSQFGWQQEWQYMSSGNFQALIEGVFMVSGLENGKFIPSVTLLNGFRDSKSGWEFGIGPTFRFVKRANGFYYPGENGSTQWKLEDEWSSIAPKDSNSLPIKNPHPIVSRLDSRGTVQLSTGLIVAVGKTFRSGYLNIPVNVFCSPRKDGWIVGASVGFNIMKKDAMQN